MLENLRIVRFGETKVSLELTFSTGAECGQALSALALWFEHGPRPAALTLHPQDVSIERQS